MCDSYIVPRVRLPCTYYLPSFFKQTQSFLWLQTSKSTPTNASSQPSWNREQEWTGGNKTSEAVYLFIISWSFSLPMGNREFARHVFPGTRAGQAMSYVYIASHR